MQITDEDINKIEGELGLSFDDVRRNILKSNKSIDVQACPGSGKTTLLGAKLLLLAKKWDSLDTGVCVLSHTNVAKEEIMKVLLQHPAGYKFTSYPHFIGTIQEFVDRYLALPFLRSVGISVRFIDNDKVTEEIKKKFAYRTKVYLERKPNLVYDFDIQSISDGSFVFNIPGFAKSSTSASYENIKNVRETTLFNGLLYYNDMYFFANYLLDNTVANKYLTARFPMVFIDEMQDTQKHQDELIQKVFSRVVVQRYGDANQAIFSGSGTETPNESYNSKDIDDFDYEINNTNRFNNSCVLVDFFKVRKKEGVALSCTDYRREKEDIFKSKYAKEGDFKHHLILYNSPSSKVLEVFGCIVRNEFPSANELVVKAIGNVGRNKIEEANALTIPHYYNYFDKDKTVKKFSPDKFIDILKLCVTKRDNYYNLFIDACREGLRRNGEYHSKTDLEDKLKNGNKLEVFNKLIFTMMNGDYPDLTKWNEYKTELLEILETQDIAFWGYDSFKEAQSGDVSSPCNIYICENGVHIELSTIHGVKGETHDATLVLETRYLDYDLSYFINNPKEVSKKMGLNELKKELLYVATSRPRHLLCLAIGKDRLSEEKIRELSQNWKIVEVA